MTEERRVETGKDARGPHLRNDHICTLVDEVVLDFIDFSLPGGRRVVASISPARTLGNDGLINAAGEFIELPQHAVAGEHPIIEEKLMGPVGEE